MEVFFLFHSLRKLQEAAEMKQYAAYLEWEGLQELDLTS